MDKGKKRERNVNFTREETEKLISLVESKIHIIENKKSDATTWKDKETAWKAVEGEFNSSAVGIFRDAKHLKLKFEALKRDTRKKARIVRAERYKAGGGTSTAPPLTPVEQKVKEMILLSVEGEDSVYDSDQPEIILEIEDEPNSKEICLEPGTDAVASTSKEVPCKKWVQWKPASLKSKENPASCKPKVKRPLDKSAENKMQKKIIEEEIEENKLRKQLLQEEIAQKKELFMLEQQQMLLKIELLKIELDNKKQK